MENKQNSALVIMDIQDGILGHLPNPAPLLANINKALVHARANGMLVIYVVVGFRKGAPEVSDNNKGFGGRKDSFAQVDMDAFMKVSSAIAPLPGDIIVTKRRVSAFTGSDFEVILRSQKIQHVVLSGLSTSGCVLSTVREAADKDYQITVISDCCADPDLEIHDLLMSKIFNKQGDVVTVDEWSKN